MSRDASIELLWAGDLRTFRLGIGELLSLQEKLDSGPQQVAHRFQYHAWRLQDVQETIRLSLIGAGEDPKKAKELVDTFAVPGKLKGSALVAHAIIMTAILGDEKDPVVGKKKRQRKKSTDSPPPHSTETARSSD